MFCLKGADYVQNEILGVGGKTGIASGAVSSPVAASKLNKIGVLNSNI